MQSALPDRMQHPLALTLCLLRCAAVPPPVCVPCCRCCSSDALPTMAVMGLTSEYDRAVAWVTNSLRFDQNMMTSFFETTIRVLGGLVSAYDLGGGTNAALLDKAKALGDRLLPVFNTPTGLPNAQINLATGSTAALSWTGGSSLLAELGTCQMEFFSLGQRLHEPSYALKAQRPIDHMDGTKPAIPGLYPIYISPTHGAFTNNRVAWGAMGDSFYEYLLKMYLLTGKAHEQYKRMYVQSVDAMLQHLYSTTPKGTAYIADLDNGVKDHKMDHLVCFVPGMLALGVKHGVVEGERATRHMDAARALMSTCYNMYHLQQPSGIGAEYSRFTPEMVPGHDASYKLRPETVESLFVLWRVTGDSRYREWGWEMWTSIDKHCRVEGGYAALLDVRQPERKEDKMESFFLAETLKYLYLLFSPNDLVPIFPTPDHPDFFVFNTECHPIKAWQSWPI